MDSNKTEYIAPHSLWLVVRKKFYPQVVFIEPAWIGTSNADEQGPVLFVSRLFAEVYAHLRNKYHRKDDTDNWQVIALENFDLLGHAHDLDGQVNCMIAFGFSMTSKLEIIVATGAPRLRFIPLPFKIPLEVKVTSFSFNRWVFDFIEKEWLSLGVTDFVEDLEKVDALNNSAFSLAAKIAVAKTLVSRTLSNSEQWGVYHHAREEWVSGEKSLYINKTMH